MSAIDEKTFSDPEWLQKNSFQALSDIACSLEENGDLARECLIRLLEHREIFSEYVQIVDSLIQKVGLFPYLNSDVTAFSTSDLLNLESHVPEGLSDIVLHSMQGRVYRALMDGANVILSAPTSFGKSLLIDAAIASQRYTDVMVIVPTIALIDETRRRLSKRFNKEFKIITHPTQSRGKRNIFVFTQERFIEYGEDISPQFFVIDEFYKLSPDRGDDRTFVLNHAFYKLYKSGAQFFLIGPNVSNITIDQNHLSFRYFDTNYSTVVAEVRHITSNDTRSEVLKICTGIKSPTLIYCKSANSAYLLARHLIENGIIFENDDAADFSQWLGDNYHPEWELVSLLRAGIAVHHGALPRSVAYHILRKFNEGAIRFLLCTSTIIEGVNTAAHNIVIYDNKIAVRKFDFFTFNNIKGRAGRMFQHFVGNVYVLNYELQQELPFVDVPVLTQPEDTPQSLLIHVDEQELSEHSAKKLRYLYAQEYLPMDLIRQNAGVSPEGQYELAEEITTKLNSYHEVLAWSGSPNQSQRRVVCKLIFDFLMNSKGRDGIFSAKQLSFKIGNFSRLKEIKRLIQFELEENDKVDNATEAVETVLVFLRRWAEFHFPRYLFAVDNIQRHIFSQAGMSHGNYQKYGSEIKKLFMPLSATTLEEYGTPYQISLKLESGNTLGDTVDEILDSLPRVDIENVSLSMFEKELLMETIENL